MSRSPAGRAKRPATILIIEDEVDIVDTLSRRLASWGLRPVAALSGAAGLAAARCEKPDVILLDLILPGMSGLDVLRALVPGDGGETPPVLVLTALPLRNAADALRLGAAGVLQKPVDPPTLRREIARVAAGER